MTRINTNIAALNTQKVLTRTNAQLQQALTRLSTGLRINSGKDDPAGLIAAEVLHSDIVSTGRAITNNERADQMLATADSALSQVDNLLIDMRALVAEAANAGTMSAEQIAANQLQIDSSLEAIDRIATSTEFEGRSLLDGSLDFVTRGVDTTKISALQIAQANFGNQTEISVAVNVHTQATHARLIYADDAIAEEVTLQIGGNEGYEAFNFDAGTSIEDIAAAVNLIADVTGVRAELDQEATSGEITATSVGDNNDIVLRAKIPGEEGGNYRIQFVADPAGSALGVTHVAPVGATPGTITVELETEAWGPATVAVDDSSSADNGLVFTANLDGTLFNGVHINLTDNGTGTAGSETVSYDFLTGELAISIASGVSTAQDVVNALAADPKVSKLFSASLASGSSGAGTLDAGDAAWTATPTFTGGVDGGTVLSTASDVIAAMQGNAELNELIEVELAAGNDGSGLVGPFDEYALYGTSEANNRLQFLAPAGAPNIRFVSEPDQELGVDLTTDPPVDGYSSAAIAGTAADTGIALTANIAGADYDGVTVRYHDRGTDAQDSVVYNPEDKTLDVYVEQGVATAQTVIDLINNDSYVGYFFSAQAGGGTGAGIIADADYGVNLATTTGGVIDEGTIIVNLATDEDGEVTTTAQDLIDYFEDAAHAALLDPLGISLSNAEGSDGSGTLAATTADLVFASDDGAAFLGNSDSANTGLFFVSIEYGSDAFVSVKVIDGGEFAVTNPAGDVTTRSIGTDVDLSINGVQAVGRGLVATSRTATLDISFSVAETVEDGEYTAFTITGGGAQFQLGPNVTASQVTELGSVSTELRDNTIVSEQTRLGISSVNTAKLGGASGTLSELKTGGAKSLETDIAGAARVLDEAMSQVSTLRGRLGAFQHTTLETNISTLSDMLETLSSAESSIRDADFAAETAELTRAQILEQAGISVLGIANETPQLVLGLLRTQ